MHLHHSRALVAAAALFLMLAPLEVHAAGRTATVPARKAGLSSAMRGRLLKPLAKRQVRPLRLRARARKPAVAAKKPRRAVARGTTSRRKAPGATASTTAATTIASTTTASTTTASSSPKRSKSLSSIVQGFYTAVANPAEVLFADILGSIVKFGLRTKEHNPFTGEVQTVALSREQEVLLGQQMAGEMISTMGISMNGSPMEAYLDGIVQRLVRSSGIDRTTPYRFKVHLVHTDQVNAFAAPGGTLVVTTGILRQMKSESHIALILAHEIGHVVARHGSQNIARDELFQDVLMTLGVAAGRDPGAQVAVLRGAAELKQAVLSFTREHENQSDDLGVRIMAGAGYSLHGVEETAGHFIAHEMAHGPSDPTTDDHPGAAERTRNLFTVARAVGLTRRGDHGADRFALNVTLPLGLGLF